MSNTCIMCVNLRNVLLNKLVRAVKIPSCISEVPGSNFFYDTGRLGGSSFFSLFLPGRVQNSKRTSTLYILSNSLFTVI